MASGKVTKRAVDALQATGATDFLWDDELRGFGVRITAAGVKSYVYQYRMGGREAPKKRATIGRHGSPWTPDSARTEAKRLALLVGQGIDPIEKERERQRQVVDLAFDRYVPRFIDGHLKAAWKDWKAGERLLLKEAVPVLGSKPLPSIKRGDIAAVLDRMADRPAVARLAHATLRILFRWAEGRGDIERSPIDGMASPPGVPSRDRVLSDDELALVWRAAGGLGYPFGPMFRLLIATGQRREEAAALTWKELDRATATWTLPAARAKNGSAHIVPLSRLAVAILDEIAAAVAPKNEADKEQVWPRSGLVFTTTGSTAASGHSRAKTRLDAAVAKLGASAAAEAEREADPVPAWRVHDLRRTLATGMQRLGVRFEVTEAILNHLSGARSGVAGIYQRHDWKAEKRTALEAWERHIEAIVAPESTTDNVVMIGGMAA